MYFHRAICLFATVMSFNLLSLARPTEPITELGVQKRQVPGLADVTGVLDEGRAVLDTLIPEIRLYHFTTIVIE